MSDGLRDKAVASKFVEGVPEEDGASMNMQVDAPSILRCTYDAALVGTTVGGHFDT